jgi:hypothetical protein
MKEKIYKNCENCKHLEWAYGDVGDSEGFVCNRKYFSSEKEEDEMLIKMNNESYRKKSKRCFEPEKF